MDSVFDEEKESILKLTYERTGHSWACQRLNSGFDLSEVSAALGHANLEMTKRYAADSVERLSGLNLLKSMITLVLNIPYVTNNPSKKVQRRLLVRNEHLELDLHYKKASKKEILK